ncbi:hypothetical protein SAMN05421647_101597 [Marinobacterium stanieri]|uniref:Uncharacterized protein n=1 Tax=Marinobacterium stanieri TaxID=49186 RepID=A0A1N6NW85_9GAMM|nr:hypothetical protein SAMN05421647_101597 [Marinobacterium stanieri]
MGPDEYRVKLDDKVRNFSVSLMNNTKWHEVLYLIAQTNVEIRFSTVWEERFSRPQEVKSPIFHEEYLGDGCLVGGPIFYKEIRELRIARFQQLRDSRTGAMYKDESCSQHLLNSLEKLGQLPLTIGDDEIILCAYA